MLSKFRLLAGLLVLILVVPARANEFTLLHQQITAARQALVTMVLYRDRRGPEQQKLVKDTADRVSATFSHLKAPAGKTLEFKQLKEAWEDFKRTRETELVPAILLNDQAAYTRIGAGIQKERLDRMYALLALFEQ